MTYERALNWEPICDDNAPIYEWRAKVPGGWLVKIKHYMRAPDAGNHETYTVTFVPDPNHSWWVRKYAPKKSRPPQQHTHIPAGYIAAIDLPDGVSYEEAFADRNTWKDFLFAGPMTIVFWGEDPMITIKRED